MAQSNEKIARDMVVAWLSNNHISLSLNDAEKTGEAIGKVYRAVLEAVRKGDIPGASISVDPAVPERRRRGQ
jgi:hypothetical protein